MRRTIAALIVLFVCGTGLWAQNKINVLFEKADLLYDQENHQQIGQVLQEAEQLASNDSEKAAVYWRQARTVLSLADEEERDGTMSESELLKEYERGEALAQKAVELNPGDNNAYYWRASNVGRWGQTKGILNSLMKASPMRDDLEIAVRKKSDHADSFYVLGMLYASVPKVISFGNVEYAVSYSRRALDAYNEEKTKYSYYLKLGEHLQKRDWDARKREREAGKISGKYRKESDPVEKYKYFEAVFDFNAAQPYSRSGVADMSDMEEALAIMKWLEGELSAKDDLTSSEKDQLKDVREHLADWQ